MEVDVDAVCLTPQSAIVRNGRAVSKKEEKAIVTVEAYRISVESPLRKRNAIVLLGAITAGLGAAVLLQTGSSVAAGGLIGTGIAVSALAWAAIKPRSIKAVSKVHVPLLLVPFRGGSVAVPPDVLSERDVPGLRAESMTFYDADVKAAEEIASNLPAGHESLRSEEEFFAGMNGIIKALTPKSKVNASLRIIGGQSPENLGVDRLLNVLIRVSTAEQPGKTLTFGDVRRRIEDVKRLEELSVRAEEELSTLARVEKTVESCFNAFERGLKGILREIEGYFSELKRLMKAVLLGGVNIHAEPTEEELRNHGYAYVQHRYHIRLNSEYPPTSLVAVFQRYVDEAERKVRGKVSEYVASMEHEIRNVQRDAERAIEQTQDRYWNEIEARQKRIRRLREEIRSHEKKLRALQDQLRELESQARRLEAEAEEYDARAVEYESRAELAETASERRSYLSGARHARREAEKLRNRARRLRERALRLRGEAEEVKLKYESRVEEVSLLEEEIEELQEEMERRIMELRERCERRMAEIKAHYGELIRMARRDVDEFIAIRDRHLEIVEGFYEKVLRAELEYQKAPIEDRLKRLQEAYARLKGRIQELRQGHSRFFVSAMSLRLDVPVRKPTLLYLPVWVIIPEKGEVLLLPPSEVDTSDGEPLKPLSGAGDFLSGLLSALRPELIQGAKGGNPGDVIREGLANLDALVRNGLLTEGEAVKIRKALGGE